MSGLIAVTGFNGVVGLSVTILYGPANINSWANYGGINSFIDVDFKEPVETTFEYQLRFTKNDIVHDQSFAYPPKYKDVDCFCKLLTDKELELEIPLGISELTILGFTSVTKIEVQLNKVMVPKKTYNVLEMNPLIYGT